MKVLAWRLQARDLTGDLICFSPPHSSSDLRVTLPQNRSISTGMQPLNLLTLDFRQYEADLNDRAKSPTMVKPNPMAEMYKRGLYKTELCKTWLETGGLCRYGDRCQYAHGFHDIRSIPRHPKYKTEPCFSYHFSGACPYGARCNFLHDEYQKLCTVDTRFKEMLQQNELRKALITLKSNLNPNAPTFFPTARSLHHESCYADTTFTDAGELTHEAQSNDSGCEHNISSDSINEPEPFIIGGFTGGEEFIKSQNSRQFDLIDPSVLLSHTAECGAYQTDNNGNRLPVFSRITSPTGKD